MPRQGSRARLGVWGLVLLSVLAHFSQLCVSWDKSLPLFELSFRVLSEAVAQMTEGGAFAALRAGDGGTKACQCDSEHVGALAACRAPLKVCQLLCLMSFLAQPCEVDTELTDEETEAKLQAERFDAGGLELTELSET